MSFRGSCGSVFVFLDEGEADPEGGAPAGTLAMGVDLAAVIGDDPVRDGKAQAGSLSDGAAGEEGFEQVFKNVFGHAASVVGECQFRPAIATGQVDSHDARVFLDTIEGVGEEVEHDLLEFLGVNGRKDSVGGTEFDLLLLVFSDMADHFDHAGHHVAEDGRLPLGGTHAREIEELLGDFLAAEGLGLDHLEVLLHDGVRFPTVERVFDEAAFEGLGAHGDGGQGVVDFVGHARGQESDPGQAFAPDHLPRAIPDLAIEIVADVLETLGHVVHGFRQFGHFIFAAEVDAIIEISGSNPSRAFDQQPQGREDPAVEEVDEEAKHHGRHADCDPGSHDHRAILVAFGVGETCEAIIEEGGELVGQVLEFEQILAEPIDGDPVEGPIAVFLDPEHLFQGRTDFGDGFQFLAVVADAGADTHVLFQLVAVLGEGGFEFFQAVLELFANEKGTDGIGLKIRFREAAGTPALQVGDKDSQMGHITAQLVGEGELFGTPTESLDDRPVAVGAEDTTAGQNRHTEREKSQAYQELNTNGPFR